MSFFEAVEEKRQEFNRDYKPELEKRRARRATDKQLGQLLKDMNIQGSSSSGSRKGGKAREEPETVSDAEAVDEGEGGLKQRYKKALEETKKDSAQDEMSFVKYIHTANVG